MLRAVFIITSFDTFFCEEVEMGSLPAAYPSHTRQLRALTVVVIGGARDSNGYLTE